MNKRPGHVNVTVETGYCNFCGRTRNLRREEHQLGTLVRTILTCESCHRTLSSSIGVSAVEPEAAEEATATVEAPAAAQPHPPAKPSTKARASIKAASKPKAEARPKAAAAKRPAKQAAPAARTKRLTRQTTTKKK